MKHAINALMMATLLAICGCGHSVLVESKITGLGAILPIGDGHTLGFVLGSMDATTATVRGGTTVETTSVSGGGIFSGEAGINHITKMQAHAQLNEGNLRDVMMSENVPDAAKIILASNLIAAAKAPELPPTVIQAQTASIHSGSDAVVSNNVPLINHSAGIDNLVNQVANVTTNVTGQIVNTIPATVSEVTDVVTDITNHTVDSVQEGSTSIFTSIGKWLRDIKWTTFFKVILGLLAALMTYFFFKGKKEVSIPVLKETRPDRIVPPMTKTNPTDQDDTPTPPPEEAPVEPAILEPQEEKKDEETPQPEEEKKEETPKVPWYKKVVEFFIWCYGMIMRIPPEQRKKLYDLGRRILIDLKKKRDAKKAAEKHD